MPLSAKQLTRPDYLTGELTPSRRVRLQIKLREWFGQHTPVACHRTQASGLVEGLWICLGCGQTQPCLDAREAGLYELVSSEPLRLRIYYWQPRSAEETSRY
jgi:hypothetical protein